MRLAVEQEEEKKVSRRDGLLQTVGEDSLRDFGDVEEGITTGRGRTQHWEEKRAELQSELLQA
jgi:hypothetical protein